jgi:hypothetical protein
MLLDIIYNVLEIGTVGVFSARVDGLLDEFNAPVGDYDELVD